jgi:hypothetical protein
MLQHNVSQDLEVERDDEVADEEQKVVGDEENVVQEQQRSRRDPGRPKLVDTWTLVNRPRDTQVVDEIFQRRKARLVAQGFF